MTTGEAMPDSQSLRIWRPGRPWLVVSAALVVVGAALLAWAGSRPVEFGWFAYAPPGATTFSPELAVWVLPGLILTVLGLVVLAFWSGLTFAARRSRTGLRLRVRSARILVPLALALLVVGIVMVTRSDEAGYEIVQTKSQFDSFAFTKRLEQAGVLLAGLGFVGLAFWSGCTENARRARAERRGPFGRS